MTAVLALILAPVYWHQLYEPGGWIHRYMGPIWLLDASIALLNVWRFRPRRERL